MATPGANRVSAPNMRAVIAPSSAIAMSIPPGTFPIMLDGQSTDGRTNQARNESKLCHGEPTSAVGDVVSTRSNAVSQMIPTVR